MSDLISRNDAIKAVEEERFQIDSDYAEGFMAAIDKVGWILKEWLPPAEPERKIYANMPDADFEKWLHDHGICNPNIHEAIPCSCVPLLIDSAINEIISVEPESDGNGSVSADTHEKMPDRTMGDLISRQDAMRVYQDVCSHVTCKECSMYNGDGEICRIEEWLKALPSAQPERLTDDDFEAIRIHLNAQKEKLCNQQRWEEAEEYQCIIDRFMAFASAQPGRKTAEWIYGENGGQDGWYCSKCGLFIPWDYEYYGLDNIDFIADFHTCPKCDRKMLKYTGMRGK